MLGKITVSSRAEFPKVKHNVWQCQLAATVPGSMLMIKGLINYLLGKVESCKCMREKEEREGGRRSEGRRKIEKEEDRGRERKRREERTGKEGGKGVVNKRKEIRPKGVVRVLRREMRRDG